jgi:2-keto-4-pentenoate hydratase/2-oxohepta-3-ene-1,7-dioic acid hydratase in catechol pathway
MSNHFSLVTFVSPTDVPVAGLVVGERVYAVVDAIAVLTHLLRPQYQTVIGILNEWDSAQRELAAAADVLTYPTRPGELTSAALSSVRLLSPVLSPSAIYCAGANYVDHIQEMERVLGVPIQNPKELGQQPWHFVKTPRNALTGTNSEIRSPGYSNRLDWEIELAVVIGKLAKDVRIEDAMSYVAGYSIANDLSARDHVKRSGVAPDSPFAYDWVSQKCFDDSCPLGPRLVPAQFVEDPYDLNMKLSVNGKLKQDSNTRNMIFDIAEQIAYLSSRVTLFPGDVILTGTPAGVGMAHKEFLQSGDTIRLEIDGIGVLENTVSM